MQREKLLRKHVAIIHAYSLMSALQRKVVNALLYEAIQFKSSANHPSVAIECTTSFSALAKTIQFSSHNTQYLKEAIDGLASLKIEWNLLKDKTPSNISFLNLRVLHGAPTFYQDGSFNFSFHKIMLDLLQNPLIYGTIDLETQAQFDSKYGHSLYENSSRFANLQKEKIIPLNTFRKLLGVPEDKYLNMRELTRNVINPAIEEVNERASFAVTLASVKAGKKIIAFNLNVKNKKQVIPHKTPSDEQTQTIAQLTPVFGAVPDKTLENIFKYYQIPYILEKLAYVKKYAKKEISGFYPLAYFISALKNDYQPANPNIEKNKNVTTSGTTVRQAWQAELNLLESEVDHWQSMLICAKERDQLAAVNSIKMILQQCQQKLTEHQTRSADIKLEDG